MFLYFIFFKVATFCFGILSVRFMRSWPGMVFVISMCAMCVSTVCVSTSTVQRRIRPSWSNWCKEATAEGEREEEERCLGQETQGVDIRTVEICTLVWCVQIWDFWFHPPCLCGMQRRWADGFYMCGSHHEAWRKRCGGGGWGGGTALLVTLLLIYSKFKAHWTSVATTAFCSDMPSHLVCS